MRIGLAILLAACLAGPIVSSANSQATKTGSSAATALTNSDVLSMLKNGLPADIVVAKIKASPSRFDTSPTELERLKAAAVPNSVILAMVEVSSHSGNPASASAPRASTLPEDTTENGKPRVYVSDSQSWLMRGGFGASNGTAAGSFRGGSSPQTVEVIKTFGQRCPDVVVTEDRDKAAFVVLFDRESFKGLLRKRDKIAVFRRNGDALYSNSVRSVGNAVKDACEAITKNFASKN